MPLDGSGRWRREGLWALEEHDGELWQLQGVSTEATAAARFRRRSTM